MRPPPSFTYNTFPIFTPELIASISAFFLAASIADPSAFLSSTSRSFVSKVTLVIVVIPDLIAPLTRSEYLSRLFSTTFIFLETS